jgi:hypothetical protein
MEVMALAAIYRPHRMPVRENLSIYLQCGTKALSWAEKMEVQTTSTSTGFQFDYQMFLCKTVLI